VAQEDGMTFSTWLIGLTMLTVGSALGADAPPADVRTPAVLDNPLQAEPLERLSATRQRPLFSSNRRPVLPPPPPPPEVVEAPPPSPPPTVVLFGIVSDDAGPHAIVRASTNDKVVRINLGDDIGGWKVTSIEARRLVLSHDSRSTAFMLFGDPRHPAGISQDEPARRRRHASD
jgi:hypothetical protein